LVAEQAGNEHWQLVFQSRSGPPSQPWLEPDVCDHLESVKQKGINNVVIMPIGFVSDHMEVMFDLDIEAKEKCEALGINMVRAGSVGVHPKFVSMIRELVLERMQGTPPTAIGRLPASHDVCPPNCCMSGRPGAVSPV
jgi:ferrochelatase